MKKNNKGFTLIELLVAIVIMISILTLAIINFNKISNEKKKEAKKKVEDTAVAAAKEFFYANEYQYEWMSDDSKSNIPLKYLVNNGYLTSLTDPTTGVKLNECSNVIIEKKNGSYKFNYDEELNCNIHNTQVITPIKPSNPKIKITDKCTGAEGDEHWCKHNWSFKVESEDNKKEDLIKERYYCTSDNKENCSLFSSNTHTITEEGTGGLYFYVKYTDNTESELSKESIYKIDHTNPTCTVTGGGNNWTNQNVTISGKCDDSLSGCRNNPNPIPKTDSLVNEKVNLGNVMDKAGNEGQCSDAIVKIDKIKPVADFDVKGKYWANRTITNTSNDTRDDVTGQSGINKIQYKKDSDTNYVDLSGTTSVLTDTGTTKITLKATDKAGNYDEIEKEVVCNKDIVTVGASGRREFTLSFNLEYSPGDVNSNYFEYIFWKITKTSDSQNTADNKLFTINDEKFKYNSYAVANDKCGDFVSHLKDKQITTTAKASYKIPSDTHAMYYCFAVRPVRSKRDNLIGIGNYFRKALYQPNNKTIDNTGWTIQYKYAYTSG